MPQLSAYLATNPNLFQPYLNDHRGRFLASEYSATPDDDITPSERRDRIQTMVNDAAAAGMAVEFTPFSTPYEIEGAIYVPKNGVRIIQDGDIKEVNGGDIYRPGLHHPAQYAGFNWYGFGVPSAGVDSSIVDEADRTAAFADLSVGTTVLVRSANYFEGAGTNPDRMRPITMLAARITAVDAGTGGITFDRALDVTPEGGAYIANAYQAGVTYDGVAVYMAERFTLEGAGRLITTGNPFSDRSALLDSRIHLAGVEAATCFYFNMLASSTVEIEAAMVTRKLVDLAGGSHNSTIKFNTTHTSGVGDDVALVAINENARNLRLFGGPLIAGEFVGNGVLIAINSSRTSLIDIQRVVAPAVTGSIVSFNNADMSGALAQSLNHDNVVRLGRVDAGACANYIVGLNTGGENKRNRVETGQFFGALTTANAVDFDGDDFYYDTNALTFENGAVVINGV